METENYSETSVRLYHKHCNTSYMTLISELISQPYKNKFLLRIYRAGWSHGYAQESYLGGTEFESQSWHRRK
jgi:hypothetical protein